MQGVKEKKPFLGPHGGTVTRPFLCCALSSLKRSKKRVKRRKRRTWGLGGKRII